jgi:hypothetical protein
MNRASISIALLVASLILLIIYGADVLIASVNSPQGVRGTGFLPFGEEVRGTIFGAGPVIMSVIAFIISRNVPSKTVSILLFVNGGLIIVGIIMTIIQATSSSEQIEEMQRTVGFTVVLGLVLIGLGAWKAIRDKRALPNQKLS